MRIMVVDVAAEYGGAATVLEQFVNEFSEDLDNEYIVILSKIYYEDKRNIKFENIEWIKRSYLHRLYFDNHYIKTLIKKYRPARVLSLQNKTLNSGRVPQAVFFQNALPISEKRFGFFEDKKLWLYQNVIGNIYKKSLNKADIVIVQADWVREELVRKWHIPIEKIRVKKPEIDCRFILEDSDGEQKHRVRRKKKSCLFYPAGNLAYKNHDVLFKALKICSDRGIRPQLVLTLNKEPMLDRQRKAFLNKEYPISYVGLLDFYQMKKMYMKSVLVFPSYIETVGLPLMEAKAMGCDILAADCKYAHDALGEYNSVKYFNPNLPDMLAELIMREFKSYE